MPEEMTECYRQLLETLKCAYPAIPDDNERLHLVYFLYHETDMTGREVAHFVGDLVGLYYLDLMGDVYDIIVPSVAISKPILQSVSDKLYNCGFQDWLIYYTQLNTNHIE